jgi:hypothetical protein
MAIVGDHLGERPASGHRRRAADALPHEPARYGKLEQSGYRYAIRLKSKPVLERRIARLLVRPVGRPSRRPKVFFVGVHYQAKSWDRMRRVVAKVERHAKYVTIQLAEVAVPRQPFASILERIGRFRQSPALCRSVKPLSLRRDGGGGGYWRTRGSGFAPAAKKGWNPMLKTDQTPSPSTPARLLTGRRQVDTLF